MGGILKFLIDLEKVGVEDVYATPNKQVLLVYSNPEVKINKRLQKTMKRLESKIVPMLKKQQLVTDFCWWCHSVCSIDFKET